MSFTITPRVLQLVDRLTLLRTRLKEIARAEVAQTIADALSEATRALICGSGLGRQLSRTFDPSDPPWDDPWRDPFEHEPHWDEDEPAAAVENGTGTRFQSGHAALTAGLAVARWSFTRSGNPAAAIGVALAVVALVLCAGKRIAPLLDACSIAQELLADPKPRP